MQVNTQILKAFKTASARYGKTAIAAMCNVPHNVPGLILKGKRTGFGWDTWERVWEVLVERGDLDPKDPECLPLSKRGNAAENAALSPEAIDLAIRWMRLPREEQAAASCLIGALEEKVTKVNDGYIARRRRKTM